MQRTVYLETTVVSYLTARRSSDPRTAVHQDVTREWWDHEAAKFRLVISELVLQEAAIGDSDASSARLAAIDELEVLTTTQQSILLAESLVENGAVPVSAAADAFHIAIAAEHGVDFLLTWNCRHLANANVQGKILLACNEAGLVPPLICTPETLIGEDDDEQ